MKRLSFVLCALLLLGACGKSTALPQNQVRPVRQNVIVDLTYVPEGQRAGALSQALAKAPKGRATACITAGPKAVGQTESLTAVLREMGVETRDVTRRAGSGNQLLVELAVVSFVQNVAEHPWHSSHWFTANAVHPAFGAATEANYARMLHDPAELDRPQELGPPNPIAGVGAVERYQGGQVRGISDQSVEVGVSGK